MDKLNSPVELSAYRRFPASQMISADDAHQGGCVMRSPGSRPDGPERLWLNPSLGSSSSERASKGGGALCPLDGTVTLGSRIMARLWLPCTLFLAWSSLNEGWRRVKAGSWGSTPWSPISWIYVSKSSYTPHENCASFVKLWAITNDKEPQKYKNTWLWRTHAISSASGYLWYLENVPCCFEENTWLT